MSSDWNTQVSNLQKTLDEIKIEVKELQRYVQAKLRCTCMLFAVAGGKVRLPLGTQ